MKDEFYGVLVCVSICDTEGAIIDDLGELFSRDYLTYEEAKRCYHSISITNQQER